VGWRFTLCIFFYFREFYLYAFTVVRGIMFLGWYGVCLTVVLSVCCHVSKLQMLTRTLQHAHLWQVDMVEMHSVNISIFCYAGFLWMQVANMRVVLRFGCSQAVDIRQLGECRCDTLAPGCTDSIMATRWDELILHVLIRLHRMHDMQTLLTGARWLTVRCHSMQPLPNHFGLVSSFYMLVLTES